MEAVEDPVGGNDHALAQKIAAKHPGMKSFTNMGGKPWLPSVCIFISTMSMLATNK